MSRQEKKGGRKSVQSKSRPTVYEGDVTLADFANSTAIKGKLRKAKTFNLVREVKKVRLEDKVRSFTRDEEPDVDRLEDQKEVKKLSVREKAWDEDSDDDELEAQNEDWVDVAKKTACRKKPSSESFEKYMDNSKEYPLDIWHLIAEYIRPEDTVTFASICKSAWQVINSPTYWINLYKRYYKNVPNLPARLKPECMVRHHGLKACVVRALYYMYPPLATRVHQGNMSTPYDLCSRQCISVWQQKLSSKWRLCFKMRRKNYLPEKLSTEEKPDLMEILEDIFANPDDGCTILQVVSTEKTLPPAVMGLTLHSIQMGSDLICASMHLQLTFGSGRICNGRLDGTGTVALSLKTVQQVSVLDWWHPCYPHSPHTIYSVCDDT